jgi:hypothetical protein
LTDGSVKKSIIYDCVNDFAKCGSKFVVLNKMIWECSDDYQKK